MRELSVFIDESGSDGLADRYYLLTLVFHEQESGIVQSIARYQHALVTKDLPDIPFHASPLLNGHGGYEGMDIACRKRLFSTFRVFFRHLPIYYTCIALPMKDYEDVGRLSDAMRRRLVDFLFDRLAYFQEFDVVKIYYDGGQRSVAEALHKALDYVLSKNAVVYRVASPLDYRLCQVADYICTVELTALKYSDKAPTATDEKFFGSWGQFKKGVLKEVRAKLLR